MSGSSSLFSKVGRVLGYVWRVLVALAKKQRGKAVRLAVRVAPLDGAPFEFLQEGDVFMLLLTTAQKVGVSIQPQDAYGNPARVDGVPAWTVSDPTFGTLDVAPDGLSAVFTAAGVPGVVQLSVTADADLGAGVRNITVTGDIQIEPSEAVSLAMIFGVPEPK